MTTYFKAVRPNGASFHDPNFRWLPESMEIPEGGYLVEHPDSKTPLGEAPLCHASKYLSVSVDPADCTGSRWPCRLLEVEPVKDLISDESYRALTAQWRSAVGN